MKKLLILFALVGIFASCEDTEDNTPAFQANLNNEFYKALDAQAIVGDDGRVAIVGTTTDEVITLSLAVLQSGTFEFNSGNGHQAIYEDGAGQIYTTENGGNGVLEITERDADSQIISGNFNFTAILEGVDTVTVDRGVFFKIPYVSGSIDPTDPNFVNVLQAEIDGLPFTPEQLTSVVTDTTIQIIGATGDDTIQLNIPLDAEPSANAIPGNGFNAFYFDAGIQEEAIQGSIEVLTHDTASQNISGIFSFTTANHQITSGQFNIDY
ncbi:MAG: DUF6252 family protein [Marinirhabdus sp.]|nr:DUF6252 family protein [Marinirhabdus sp.]